MYFQPVGTAFKLSNTAAEAVEAKKNRNDEESILATGGRRGRDLREPHEQAAGPLHADAPDFILKDPINSCPDELSWILALTIADHLDSTASTPVRPILHLQTAGRQGSRNHGSALAPSVSGEVGRTSSLGPLLNVLGCILACLSST